MELRTRYSNLICTKHIDLNQRISFVLGTLILFQFTTTAQSNSIDLSGKWAFAIDKSDVVVRINGFLVN
jgi:hypothetical protein